MGQIIKKKTSINYNYLYNAALTNLHPEFHLFNFTPDSSRLFIKIKQKELMYAWVEAQEIAFVKITVYLLDMPQQQPARDSISYTMSDVKQKDSLRSVMFSLDYKSDTSESAFLKIVFEDVRSSRVYEGIIRTMKNQKQNQQAIIISDGKPTNPNFLNVVNNFDSIYFHTQKGSPEKCSIKYFGIIYAPAAPPFQPGAKKRLIEIPDKKFDYEIKPDQYLILKGVGLYFFQYDTTYKTGYSIGRFANGYPDLTEIDQRIEALRYLLNQQEYFEFKSNASPGKRFKQFWVDISEGSENPPHLLMATYYNRVAGANKYFTAYCEGWKSDRGMIYIVFGKPDVVTFDKYSETWIYTQAFDNLKLVFEKSANPLSPNDYVLIRDSKYEIPWQSALNAWRTGVIFGH